MVQTTSGEVTPTGVTPAQGVANATPSQPLDAGNTGNSNNEIEALRQQFERAQQDLNKMKSSFQRNEAKAQQEWQQRQSEYEREIERLRVSTMDENQRKEYEASAGTRRAQELEQQLAEYQNIATEAQSMLKAQQWFIAKGVPITELDLENGYDSLWNSGMEFITNDYERLRSSSLTPPSAPAPAAPQKPPVAPEVVTQTNTPAFSGNTWADLEKMYGSQENVYRLVETGQLDPSVIPGFK